MPLSRTLRIVLLVAWMALIFYWSGQPDLPIDHPPIASLLAGFQHRLAHLLGFGILGLLAYASFDGLSRRATLAVLFVSLYGATDEFHQTFTPGRRAAIDDWLFDTISAILLIVLWQRLRPRIRLTLAALGRRHAALP